MLKNLISHVFVLFIIFEVGGVGGGECMIVGLPSSMISSSKNTSFGIQILKFFGVCFFGKIYKRDENFRFKLDPHTDHYGPKNSSDFLLEAALSSLNYLLF